MARPVNANAARTRGRVLGAATRLFASQGRDGASMRAIATEADVSLATIHHYFDNKQGLYDRCVEQMYEELAALRAELIPGEVALEDALDMAVRAGFRFARTHQGSIRLLMRTVIDRGELDSLRREQHQMPHLLEGARLVAAALGRPVQEVQLNLQSMIHLTVRYALSTNRELCGVSGLEHDVSDPGAHIEDHLVQVARRLFSPEGARG
jgi:AcrR family transcriptional regulator